MPKKAFNNLSDANREELMNKAMRLYVDHPYTDITLKMILEALSLHPTTFYRYFEDKDELYGVLLYEVARKRKDFLESRQHEDGSSSFYVDDNSSEPLSELEVKFAKTLTSLPEKVLLNLYFHVFKDETVAIHKSRLRQMRYEGKLRPDIDDDLISFIGATISFNLILFSREAGIEDEELQSKLDRYFFDSFFNHGLMTDAEFSKHQTE